VEQATRTNDLWSGLFTARARRELLQRAALQDGESFLELGVGTGLTFAPLARSNPCGRNDGLDQSDGMLRRCRRRLQRCGATRFTLREGDARDLPYEDETFDLVLCGYLFELLPDPDAERVLRQILRVLCNGGRLLLASSTRRGVGIGALVDRAAVRLLGGQAPEGLGVRMIAAGFRNVSSLVYSQRLFSSEVIRAIKLTGGGPS